MKYIPYLAAALLLAGCADNIQRTDSPVFPSDSAAVYFAAPDETGSEADPTLGITTHTVTIGRTQTEGSLTVPITIIENTDDIFTVPSSVTFADGATSASFDVSFPDAELGKEYFLTLSVDDDHTNPYLTAQATYQLSMTLISWTDAPEKAVIVDGFFSMYGINGKDYPFYCAYQTATLPDGSTRYRFLNPYNVVASADCAPDEYGVYPMWVLFEDGDVVDPTANGNMVAAVDNDNNVTIAHFLIGADLGYGVEYGGSVIGNYYALGESDTYNPGILDNGVITFAAGDLYIYEDDVYSAGEMSIWLSAAAYQSAVSAIHITDFNDPQWQWDTLANATTQYESQLFGVRWQDQPLCAAIDLDPEHGTASEFLNLYYLPSLYADGYGFAFYWNPEDGSLSVPSNQPTGKTLFDKQIVVSSAGTAVANTYTVQGETVTELTFPLSVQTDDGNLIGTYTETYLCAANVIHFTAADYVGAFTLSGTPFVEDDATSLPVEIGNADGTFAITGIPYAKSIAAAYDETANLLTISAQSLATQKVNGQFKKMILFPTVDGEESEAPLLLEMSLRGIIELSPSSEADGFAIYCTSDEQLYGGMSHFTLTPAATASAPAPAPVAVASSIAHAPATFASASTPASAAFATTATPASAAINSASSNVSEAINSTPAHASSAHISASYALPWCKDRSALSTSHLTTHGKAPWIRTNTKRY